MVVRTFDTLYGQCFLRSASGMAEQKGIDLEARKGQKLKALRLARSAMPKANRVATFIVEWALALHDSDGEELTLTEWRRWSNESERTAWRHLAEFRELFPEFETPTPLATQLLKRMRREKLDVAAAINLPISIAAVQ